MAWLQKRDREWHGETEMEKREKLSVVSRAKQEKKKGKKPIKKRMPDCEKFVIVSS